jgi:hypothetical protein
MLRRILAVFAICGSALGADLNLYGLSSINFDTQDDGTSPTAVLSGGSGFLNSSVSIEATDFVLSNSVSLKATILKLQADLASAHTQINTMQEKVNAQVDANSINLDMILHHLGLMPSPPSPPPPAYSACEYGDAFTVPASGASSPCSGSCCFNNIQWTGCIHVTAAQYNQGKHSVGGSFLRGCSDVTEVSVTVPSLLPPSCHFFAVEPVTLKPRIVSCCDRCNSRTTSLRPTVILRSLCGELI